MIIFQHRYAKWPTLRVFNIMRAKATILKEICIIHS